MNQDLISRQAAIDALDALCDRECEYSKKQRSFMCGACRLGSAFDVIDELPSAQPEHLVKESGNLVNGLVNDCISRQGVIEVLSQYPFEKAVNCISIIEEFPSAQPEQTDCEYCHEDSDGYVKPIEKNCHAFIRFGMDGWELSLNANGWHGSAKIRYCPMCGRDLRQKGGRE